MNQVYQFSHHGIGLRVMTLFSGDSVSVARQEVKGMKTSGEYAEQRLQQWVSTAAYAAWQKNKSALIQQLRDAQSGNERWGIFALFQCPCCQKVFIGKDIFSEAHDEDLWIDYHWVAPIVKLNGHLLRDYRHRSCFKRQTIKGEGL